MNNKRIISAAAILLLMISLFSSLETNVKADEGEFLVKVNMAMNCLTVYEKGTDGEYSKPSKSMTCAAFEKTSAEDENYSIIAKKDWKQMRDGTFSQYVMEISADISICSSPYSAQSKDSLYMNLYNKIGEDKSTINIWLCAADAKWLYDNCKEGTQVILYNDESSAGPLGKPRTIKLPETSKFINWDPTDADENNPWKDSTARIEGVKDLELSEGDDVNLLSAVKGYDLCGNDVTEDIIIMGSYNLNKEGMYSVTYYLKDASGSQVNQSANIHVKKSSAIETMASNGEIESTLETDSENNISNSEKIKIIVGIGIAAMIVAYFIVKSTKKD